MAALRPTGGRRRLDHRSYPVSGIADRPGAGTGGRGPCPALARRDSPRPVTAPVEVHWHSVAWLWPPGLGALAWPLGLALLAGAGVDLVGSDARRALAECGRSRPDRGRWHWPGLVWVSI